MSPTRPAITLFNANPRSAYRAGFLTGTHTMATLTQHGDLGLGGLDRNDGELVVLDGHAYRTAHDGTTKELEDTATTPYATVLPFRPTHTVDVSTSDRDGLEQAMAASLPLTNRIWALRVHGTFTQVTAGASEAQRRPYRPLSEIFEEYNWIRHEHTTGTLVGFSCPPYLLGLNFVGFHFHWLSDDHRQGGHVVDYSVESATVQAAEATAFTLDVATYAELHELDLTAVN